MRLVIVDDDLLTAEVVRDSVDFEIFGINDIEIAHNVAGAKKLFEEKIPDIVICDIEMPKGSGIDLLKWVRANNHKSEFIFLTCHESFEFASIALNYNASAYITKPFNADKIEIAISKAVEKIRKEGYFTEYSQYGQYWMENKNLMIENFWRDLLFFSIKANAAVISEEITKRKLSLNVNEFYYLVLVSVIKSQDQGTALDDQTFEYALKKLSSEVILGELDFEHTIYYVTNRNYNVAVIMRDTQYTEQIKNQCLNLIDSCNQYLKCTAACYIGKKSTISSLPRNRMKLEEMDKNNIALMSKVFFQDDEDVYSDKGQYVIDANVLSQMFEKREKLQIVNYLKNELELLLAKGNLDALILYSIHQDFMQIVHMFLYKNEIQAHKLFSDKVAQKLNINADNSMFDMLKWVHFVITKTMEYVEEVEKSQTIIEKAKKYIQEHYIEDITRNDVAAIVFLTPDYLAKMFKSETSVSIKEYINQCRIDKAKDLLRNSNANISMIASEVGFDNFSYFSTVFKKLTGTNPNLFRKEDEK